MFFRSRYTREQCKNVTLLTDKNKMFDRSKITLTESKRAEVVASLAKLEDLIVRAAVALGQHPTNRDLQTRFAKLVSNRDRLEVVLKADREGAG